MTNILTEEDLKNIETALETIKVLRSELKKAIQAGVTPPFTEQDLTEREAQLLKLKRTYFPTGRVKTPTEGV